MRTREAVEADIETAVADCRSAAAENDDISYNVDHDRLNDLLSELEQIPRRK